MSKWRSRIPPIILQYPPCKVVVVKHCLPPIYKHYFITKQIREEVKCAGAHFLCVMHTSYTLDALLANIYRSKLCVMHTSWILMHSCRLTYWMHSFQIDLEENKLLCTAWIYDALKVYMMHSFRCTLILSEIHQSKNIT